MSVLNYKTVVCNDGKIAIDVGFVEYSFHYEGDKKVVDTKQQNGIRIFDAKITKDGKKQLYVAIAFNDIPSTESDEDEEEMDFEEDNNNYNLGETLDWMIIERNRLGNPKYILNPLASSDDLEDFEKDFVRALFKAVRGYFITLKEENGWTFDDLWETYQKSQSLSNKEVSFNCH